MGAVLAGSASSSSSPSSPFSSSAAAAAGGHNGTGGGTGRSDAKAMLVGAALWSVGTAVGMGGCSWWLIGLQKYKNVVIGPWDPARPVIRQVAGWE